MPSHLINEPKRRITKGCGFMKRFFKITFITSLFCIGILGVIILIKSSLNERVFATNNPPNLNLDENDNNNSKENKSNDSDIIDTNNNQHNNDNKGINNSDIHIDNKKEISEIVGEELYNFDSTKILPVKNPNSIYVLVNKNNELDSNYQPDDLVIPNVKFPFEGNDPKKQMRADAAFALENLINGAKEDGHDIVAVSGFRSYNRQKAIYEANVKRMGEDAANKVSAKPGQSEHQTGLAMDVSSKSIGYILEESFGEVPEGIWLSEHAHEYGFIIRYQKDKTDITGYSYEPWHIRYVGIELATYLYENNLTLEEFYEGKI